MSELAGQKGYLKLEIKRDGFDLGISEVGILVWDFKVTGGQTTESSTQALTPDQRTISLAGFEGETTLGVSTSWNGGQSWTDPVSWITTTVQPTAHKTYDVDHLFAPAEFVDGHALDLSSCQTTGKIAYRPNSGIITSWGRLANEPQVVQTLPLSLKANPAIKLTLKSYYKDLSIQGYFVDALGKETPLQHYVASTTSKAIQDTYLFTAVQPTATIGSFKFVLTQTQPNESEFANPWLEFKQLKFTALTLDKSEKVVRSRPDSIRLPHGIPFGKETTLELPEGYAYKAWFSHRALSSTIDGNLITIKRNWAREDLHTTLYLTLKKPGGGANKISSTLFAKRVFGWAESVPAARAAAQSQMRLALIVSGKTKPTFTKLQEAEISSSCVIAFEEDASLTTPRFALYDHGKSVSPIYVGEMDEALDYVQAISSHAVPVWRHGERTLGAADSVWNRAWAVGQGGIVKSDSSLDHVAIYDGGTLKLVDQKPLFVPGRVVFEAGSKIDLADRNPNNRILVRADLGILGVLPEVANSTEPLVLSADKTMLMVGTSDQPPATPDQVMTWVGKDGDSWLDTVWQPMADAAAGHFVPYIATKIATTDSQKIGVDAWVEMADCSISAPAGKTIAFVGSGSLNGSSMTLKGPFVGDFAVLVEESAVVVDQATLSVKAPFVCDTLTGSNGAQIAYNGEAISVKETLSGAFTLSVPEATLAKMVLTQVYPVIQAKQTDPALVTFDHAVWHLYYFDGAWVLATEQPTIPDTLLSINMAGSNNGDGRQGAVTGAKRFGGYPVAGDGWNNFPARVNTGVALDGVDGVTVPGVTFTSTGSNNYTNGAGVVKANIFNSFIDDGSQSTLQVNGLDADRTYTVYVYMSTNNDTNFSAPFVNGTQYSYSNGYTQAGSANWGSSATTTLVDTVAVEGSNYLKIVGVSGPTITVNGKRNGGARGGIAAIQVVSEPRKSEIAPISLSGLSGQVKWSELPWAEGVNKWLNAKTLTITADNTDPVEILFDVPVSAQALVVSGSGTVTFAEPISAAIQVTIADFDFAAAGKTTVDFPTANAPIKVGSHTTLTHTMAGNATLGEGKTLTLKGEQAFTNNNVWTHNQEGLIEFAAPAGVSQSLNLAGQGEVKMRYLWSGKGDYTMLSYKDDNSVITDKMGGDKPFIEVNGAALTFEAQNLFGWNNGYQTKGVVKLSGTAEAPATLTYKPHGGATASLSGRWFLEGHATIVSQHTNANNFRIKQSGTVENPNIVVADNAVAALQLTDAGMTIEGGKVVFIQVGEGATFSITGAVKSMGDNCKINKTGNGTLTLDGANTYNGGTSVTAGTVVATQAKSFGTGAATFAEGTTLAVDVADTQTIATTITGAGNLVKCGTGMATLTKTSLTGTTAIEAGVLNIGAARSFKLDSLATGAKLAVNATTAELNAKSLSVTLTGAVAAVPADAFAVYVVGTRVPLASVTTTNKVVTATLQGSESAIEITGNGLVASTALADVNALTDLTLTVNEPTTLTMDKAVVAKLITVTGTGSLTLTGSQKLLSATVVRVQADLSATPATLGFTSVDIAAGKRFTNTNTGHLKLPTVTGAGTYVKQGNGNLEAETLPTTPIVFDAPSRLMMTKGTGAAFNIIMNQGSLFVGISAPLNSPNAKITLKADTTMILENGDNGWTKTQIIVDAPKGEVTIAGSVYGNTTNLSGSLSGTGTVNFKRNGGWQNKVTVSGLVSGDLKLKSYADQNGFDLTNVNNSYTGGTEVMNLLSGNPKAFGSGDIVVAATGKLTINGNDPLTIKPNQALGGAGQIVGNVAFEAGAILDASQGTLTITKNLTGTPTIRLPETPAEDMLLVRCTNPSAADAFEWQVEGSSDWRVDATTEGYVLKAASAIASARVSLANWSGNVVWANLPWTNTTEGWSDLEVVTIQADNTVPVTIALSDAVSTKIFVVTGGGDVTITPVMGSLSAESYNLADATGKVTLNLDTGAAPIKAGAQTICAKTMTGTATLGEGKKLTLKGEQTLTNATAWVHNQPGVIEFAAPAGVTQSLDLKGQAGVKTRYLWSGKGDYTMVSYNDDNSVNTTNMSADKPFIEVNGASLTFEAQNLFGWQNGYQTKGVVKLSGTAEAPATLTYKPHGGATASLSGRWFLEGHATIVSQHTNANNFRIKQSGTVENPNIVVADNAVAALQLTDAGMTIEGGKVVFIQVGEGATFSITGAVKSMGDNCKINKTGNGTLTLDGANTYNGGTSVTAGTVVATQAKSFGTGAATFAEGTTLAVDVADTQTIATTITGVGNLVKCGTGMATLTKTSLTGKTAIEAGALNIGETRAAKLDAIEPGAMLAVNATSAEIEAKALSVTLTGAVEALSADSLAIYVAGSRLSASVSTTDNVVTATLQGSAASIELTGADLVASTALATVNALTDLTLVVNDAATLAMDKAIAAKSIIVTGTGSLTLTGSQKLLSATTLAAQADVTASTTTLGFTSVEIATGKTFTYANGAQMNLPTLSGAGTYVKQGTGKIVVNNGLPTTPIVFDGKADLAMSGSSDVAFNITMKQGRFDLPYGCKLSSTEATLTLEAGTTFELRNGDSGLIKTKIFIKAPQGEVSICGSIYGNNTNLAGPISGEGTLHFKKTGRNQNKLTVSGVISGAIKVVSDADNGGISLTNANNSYTGGTVVNAKGRIGGSGKIPGTLQVAAGGFINRNYGILTVDTLAGTPTFILPTTPKAGLLLLKSTNPSATVAAASKVNTGDWRVGITDEGYVLRAPGNLPVWVPEGSDTPELEVAFDAWKTKFNVTDTTSAEACEKQFLLGIAPNAEPTIAITKLTINPDGTVTITHDREAINGKLRYEVSSDLKTWTRVDSLTGQAAKFVKVVITW